MKKPIKRPAKRIASGTLKNMKEKNIEKWLKTPKAKKFISKIKKENNKIEKILEDAKKPPHPTYGKK